MYLKDSIGTRLPFGSGLPGRYSLRVRVSLLDELPELLLQGGSLACAVLRGAGEVRPQLLRIVHDGSFSIFECDFQDSAEIIS